MAPSELTKLSVVGTTEWIKGLWAVTVGNLEQTPDSSILVCGNYYVEGPGFRFAYYEVVDQNGGTKFAKLGGFGGYGGKQTFDNKYIIIGAQSEEEQGPYYSLLSKRDSNQKWIKEYSDRGLADVVQNIDSGFVYCGRDTSGNAFIAKTTSTGNEISALTFGGSLQDIFYNIVQTTGGGYIAVGNTRSTDGTVWGLHDSTDIYIVRWKQDTSVHAPPPLLSIKQQASKIDEVKVYPTLSNGIVNVSLPRGYEGADINVFDIVGRAVEIKNAGTGNKRCINLSQQPAGQYILEVRMNSERRSFRVSLNP